MHLRQWRKANRYSLPKLAEALEDDFKTTHQTLSNYERGVTCPPKAFIDAIRKLSKGQVKAESFGLPRGLK